MGRNERNHIEVGALLVVAGGLFAGTYFFGQREPIFLIGAGVMVIVALRHLLRARQSRGSSIEKDGSDSGR